MAVARANDGVIVASHVAQKDDFDHGKYRSACEEVISAPDFRHKVVSGSRYRMVGDFMAFNFTTDPQNRVFIVITAAEYPERLVFPMINSVAEEFTKSFGPGSLTCGQGALSKKATSMFARFVQEYEDPSTKDKLSQVAAKVDDVKLTMHSNIDSMLRNLDQTQQIETDTERLQDQARLFDRQANSLKRREQWRNMKFTIIIGLIVVIIIVILLVYLFR